MRATEPGSTVGGHGADARLHVPAEHPPNRGQTASALESAAAVEELLRGLGVVANGLRSVTVSSQRALQLVPLADGITLLVVRHGEVRFSHDATEPSMLVSGDAVVVTGGRPFVLTDGSIHAERLDPLQDLSLDGPAQDAPIAPIAPDAKEPTGEVVIATYAPTGGRRGVADLPEVVVRPGACGPGSGVEVLDAGAHAGRPSDMVVARMLDWLLPCHLAGWLEDDPEALDRLHVTDDIIGPALRTFHESPDEPWTVAALAASVGVSRATFTRRFRERMGESPMRYLAGLRLALAAEQLIDSDATLDGIAHQVGYADGFALSRAFSRAFGVSPSTYRRERRTGSPCPSGAR